MALKIVVFALTVSICKVQSQSIGCLSNSQSSSNNQPSCGCGPQTQLIQLQPSNSNKGLKASPQLQIVPGQNCNLQAIPISQLLSQGSNLQRPQTGCSAPRQQGIQVTSIPKIPSPTAQCAQPVPCNPTVISAPVSTITIPPTSCTTIIDHSLCNSLANALQMMIANDFINSAVSNNIINQDCISVPVVETSVSGFNLNSFLKSLNAGQLGTAPTASKCPQEPSGYDWEKLLDQLRDDNKCGAQPQTCDWSTVLDYLNSQNDRCDVEVEPESTCDYSPLIDYLKQTGQTASQISSRPVQGCGQVQNYNLQRGVYVPSSQSDIDSSILEALAAYLGCSATEVSSSSYPNVAEVVFPEEIPAQLICNYGYMPTSVPVVSFSVQPIGDSSNFIVGTKC